MRRFQLSYSSKNPYGNKTVPSLLSLQFRLILAKIHMVTKLKKELIQIKISLILAKIHMVTKL